MTFKNHEDIDFKRESWSRGVVVLPYADNAHESREDRLILLAEEETGARIIGCLCLGIALLAAVFLAGYWIGGMK